MKGKLIEKITPSKDNRYDFDEWTVKISIAALLSLLMMSFLPYIKGAQNDKKNCLGVYSPENDTIWIKENLSPSMEEQVRTHEELHQQFYHALPFYGSVKDFGIFLVFFGLFLLLLTAIREMLYIPVVGIFLLVVPELHAYGTNFFINYPLNSFSFVRLISYMVVFILPFYHSPIPGRRKNSFPFLKRF